jgi:hypothetical protein
MAEYTMADLCWFGVREYRNVGTGKFYSSRGRVKEVMVGIEFVDTIGAGKMCMSDWYDAMEDAIQREGQASKLAEKLEIASNLAWLHTDKAIREYALELIERDVRNGNM